MVTPGHGDTGATPGRPRDGRGRYIRNHRTAERDAEACRLRMRGSTYEQIAQQLGYSHRDLARRAVQRALTAVVSEPAAELRQLELIRLDELWRRGWAVLDREHHLVQAGRVVRDAAGSPVPDWHPVLRAIDSLLRVMDRRARLLGLDAPVRVVPISIGEIEAEIAALERDLAVEGDDDQ